MGAGGRLGRAATVADDLPTWKRRWRRFRHSDLAPALLFIGPWILGFLAFQLYPLLASIYFSFTSYNIVSSPVWVGLANYAQLLFHDTLFREALAHTLVFTAISVPLNLVTAFGIALLLNRRMPGRGFLRAAFFIPAVVPSVANAILWVMLLRNGDGLVDVGLHFLHLPSIDWLYDPSWALAALILVNLWGIGPSIVIFLAGLQDVPRELYESASIDGARAFRRVRHITIPLVSPVILFVTVIGIINAMQVFALPFVIFGYVGAGSGGPGNSALLYSVQLFNVAFSQLAMGYAAAMAWVLFAIIFIFSLASIRISRRLVHYQ